MLIRSLQAYVADRIAEFDQVAPVRRARLAQIAAYIRTCRAGSGTARLMFICTHNSRRSQLAQLWARAAAAHFGVSNVLTYSAGTEATAFNPRAVAAAERAGFEIRAVHAGGNPVYVVCFDRESAPVECFSKTIQHASNPHREFCAVMVCSDADAGCPIVPGAAARVVLPYEDPKAFDDTPEEAAKYDERCRDIARELLWLFAELSNG
jgi:hypothetical protein